MKVLRRVDWVVRRRGFNCIAKMWMNFGDCDFWMEANMMCIRVSVVAMEESQVWMRRTKRGMSFLGE